MNQPIIMDVDTGIDDSLALLYLLASPEADILAITCTSGNVPARQVAINNLAWLELCKAPQIEVALGSEVPVLAPLMTTEETHGPQGIGHAELPGDLPERSAAVLAEEIDDSLIARAQLGIGDALHALLGREHAIIPVSVLMAATLDGMRPVCQEL